MHTTANRSALLADLALIAFLVAFDVLARLLPHAWGFMPIAASALFAGRMLRNPVLAPIVPLAAMAVSGLALSGDDWRISLITYAALTLPAFAGMATRNWRGIVGTAGTMVACSVAFFVLSNFAVWAFSGMYSHTLAGLTQCYVLALPFFQNSLAGDLFWTAVLFGGAYMIQRTPLLSRLNG
ncbi:DUF6580 family putative transport protein [Undibacter mobilis]|uniref:Uncharacterized protein n=1 Tax=Undibacter mobilis TaxID=2292256 RepID=A0A371B9Z8_9BRAD|nr:DUF6580 family putative transport protein [Undibacter mobilis]RDV04408.1 hypothetical protein DXH78_07365 [Undibacter mobilis]